MNAKIAALQQWLNIKGMKPQLVEDGVRGPATRAAIFETFANKRANSVTGDDIRALALRLGCTERQIKAVAKVESGGAGWDASGLLACLYERHYGWKRFQIKNALLSNPSPGGYTVDANRNGINDSWEKVADAALTFREPNKAFECASWGRFQIMGAWWEKLGYNSAIGFVWELSRGEAAHYDAFARYIERFGLLPALRQIDGDPANCLAFARGYNGKGQRGYDARIASAYRALVG